MVGSGGQFEAARELLRSIEKNCIPVYPCKLLGIGYITWYRTTKNLESLKNVPECPSEVLVSSETWEQWREVLQHTKTEPTGTNDIYRETLASCSLSIRVPGHPGVDARGEHGSKDHLAMLETQKCTLPHDRAITYIDRVFSALVQNPDQLFLKDGTQYLDKDGWAKLCVVIEIHTATDLASEVSSSSSAGIDAGSGLTGKVGAGKKEQGKTRQHGVTFTFAYRYMRVRLHFTQAMPQPRMSFYHLLGKAHPGKYYPLVDKKEDPVRGEWSEYTPPPKFQSDNTGDAAGQGRSPKVGLRGGSESLRLRGGGDGVKNGQEAESGQWYIDDIEICEDGFGADLLEEDVSQSESRPQLVQSPDPIKSADVPQVSMEQTPRLLPRPSTKDPAVWKEAFKIVAAPLEPDGPITNGDLINEVCKCGDLCEITYNNFLNNDKTLSTFKDATKANPILAKHKKVGDFKYGPNEVMKLPAGTGPTELNVAWRSPARDYKIGIVQEDGSVENDTTFYLEATSGFYSGEFAGSLIDDETTNWIGYIAINGPAKGGPLPEGGRDIVVAFRGTQATTEWLSNFTAEMISWEGESKQPWWKQIMRFIFGALYIYEDEKITPANVSAPTKGEPVPPNPLLAKARVAKGFDMMYRRFTQTPGNTLSMQGQVQVAVRKLLAFYGEEVGSITITGHSLGGALAQICAFDLVESGVNHQGDSKRGALVPVTAITFEAPRAGNWAFSDYFQAPEGPRHLRIWNVPDIVPKVPYLAWSEGGLLALPISLFWLLPINFYEVFGFQAGQDASRPKEGEREKRLAFYHTGTPYKTKDNESFQGWSHTWRQLLFVPLLPSLTNFLGDLGAWHSFQRVLGKIAPGQRTDTGLRDYS